MAITDILNRNCSIRQRKVSNERKKSLHSITLSGVLSVLSVACPIFERISASQQPNSFLRKFASRLCILQKVVSYTHWWPESIVDGEDSAEFVTGVNPHQYLDESRKFSKDYVTSVDRPCAELNLTINFLDKNSL